MDKKLAGLLGAVAGLATMGAANAAVQGTSAASPLPVAASYAELLGPVGNASELLVADDAVRTQSEGSVQLAQYHHHHHHHHTRIIVRPRHHHHHRKIIIRTRHHHHHHHHSMYIQGDAKKV